MQTATAVNQNQLFPQVELHNLDHPFFKPHLITYLGNKRRLAGFLYSTFLYIRKRTGKDKMKVFDGFVGSGASARLLKPLASELHVNDLEDYAETINKAYLANRSDYNQDELSKWITYLNENKFRQIQKPGFIETHYAPNSDNNIQPGERVFYSNSNARIIDNIRKMIEQEVDEHYRIPCLASLLVQASVHTNTSGVFKGFHKKDGVGHFGGKSENALTRIMGEIHLKTPIFSDFECQVSVHKQDVNKLIRNESLPHFDLVYYDPPYNQHPYGSNYFMLNVINGGRPVEIQSGVSGITKEWNKSV